MLSLVIDHQAPYLSSSCGVVSLAALPFGTGSFLDHVATTMAGVADGDLLVMPAFQPGSEYKEAIESSTSRGIKVISPETLPAVLSECEPADFLLAVDLARWPGGGFDLAEMTRDHCEYRGASHVVAIGSGADNTREHVERDGQGAVRRVQRLYDRISWPEVAAKAVFLSFAPARVVGDTRFGSLAELRSALSAKGVLSRDIPLSCDVLDLREEAGFLALHEQMLAAGLQRRYSGTSTNGGDIVIGRGCSIAESARMVAPIIIHDNVTVEEGATIIGPALVATASHVGRGSTVVNSILAPNTVVDDRAAVVHRVGSGRCSGSMSDSDVRTYCFLSLEHAQKQQHTDGRIVAIQRGKQRYRRMQMILKRTIDLVLASMGLVVFSPLLVLVAIAIKLESRGPVLFSHRREQRNGKEFPCLKFRTMCADAHRRQRELYKDNEVDGPQFKINHDPRLTRIGPLLRSTNIDELPQLVNVVLGHMSLVGPRPSPFRENQICVPWRRARLSVRPGVTGLWQLCRDDREGGDFHQWIYYDLVYVRNLSVRLDIKILLATVLTLGGRHNAPLSWFVRGADVEPDFSEVTVVEAAEAR